MSEQQSALAALEAAHTFPGPFTFKVIARAREDLQGDIGAAVAAELGPACPFTHSTRASAGGAHQAVTLVVQVPHAAAVLALYARLRGLSGLHFLL